MIARLFRYSLLAATFVLGASKTLASDVDIFPSWVSFGRLPVDYVASRTVHIRNRSNQEIRSLRFWESGDRQHFRIYDFSCWSLRPRGTCTLRIDYNPRHIGRHRLNIEVRGNPFVWNTIRVDGEAYDPIPERP